METIQASDLQDLIETIRDNAAAKIKARSRSHDAVSAQRYTCGQCFKPDDPFMVHDHLWEDYGNGKGVMCMTCFESRLGRHLAIGDFKPVVINIPIFKGYEMALRQGTQNELS